VSDTATTGLNLTDTYIGYYDGTDFKTYIQSNGNFHFGGASSNFIDFNGTQLVIDTDNFSVDGVGNATFGGDLSAATGTFSGELTAATGTFRGALSAATGTFSGDLSAVGGTFAGTLDASSISTGTLDVARLANIGSAQIADGAIINANIGNAQITTAKIDDAQVDTLQIKGQAVTFPRGTQAGNSVALNSAGVNILSLTITASGAPLIITGSANIIGSSGSSDNDAYGSLALYRGGTALYGPVRVASPYVEYTGGRDGTAYTIAGGGSIQVYIPAGVTGTYYLRGYGAQGDTPNATQRSLTIMEAKR
jgi:hypothetical protein